MKNRITSRALVMAIAIARTYFNSPSSISAIITVDDRQNDQGSEYRTYIFTE